MSKGSILVVHGDFNYSNMLKIYFSGQGYTVEVAPKGQDALDAIKHSLPNLIVLDINLPDMNGYDVCKELRTTIRTSHIPIIFLTQKDERSNKIIGLELGADDYVTKPFHIEELKLRIQNSLDASIKDDSKPYNPITGLAMGYNAEMNLRELIIEKPRDWVYLDIKIGHFEPYKAVYGWQAGDTVQQVIAKYIKAMIEETEFAGHVGSDYFIMVVNHKRCQQVIDTLTSKFQGNLATFYSVEDLEQGFIVIDERTKPLMSLAFGVFDSTKSDETDIRTIVELAADDRRSYVITDDDDDILTAW